MEEGKPIPTAHSPEPPPEERLDSWKEIAAYLKRDIRTVQRWEKEQSLPVYRHIHRRQGTVYAFRPEVETWWRNGQERLEALEREAQKEKRAPPRRQWLIAAGAVAGVLAVVAALALWAPWRSSEPESAPPMRFSVEVPQGESFQAGGGTAVVISPDGTRLALNLVGADGASKLFVRSLDQLQATEISGTGDVDTPFFSPDGEWIGFFGNGKLKKVSVRGGATVTLGGDVQVARGGSWSEDGAIIFAATNNSGLSRVSSAGGTPEAVTTLDEEDEEKEETAHRWPQVLPGGKAVLFTVLAGSVGEPYIEVQSLETGERKTLQQGGIYGRYLPTGHLAYVREGTLFAAPFDLGRLEVTGPPTPIVEDVQISQVTASAQFDFSQTGTLVYLTGG